MSKNIILLKQVFNNLSWFDKLLPINIVLAIVIGLVVSKYSEEARDVFQGDKILNVPIPLAIGMVVMMVPPLCKVQWENLKSLSRKKNFKEQLVLALIFGWVICPFLMLALAWLTLFDQDDYRTGVILIGCARCIAMVLIWNEVAGGDTDLCATLVIINSLLQIILYAPYKIWFCDIMGAGTGDIGSISTTYKAVSQTVGFFLGVPMALGLLIRMTCLLTIGLKTFEDRVMPFINPFGMIGLLYTIIVIFIEKGDDFLNEIGTAFRCFVPLILYFLISWCLTFFGLRFWDSKRQLDQGNYDRLINCGCEENKLQAGLTSPAYSGWCSASYQQVITQALVASSNNFELSLTVAIALYGTNSRQAIAATFGPLVEIPVLLILCFISRFFENKLLWKDQK